MAETGQTVRGWIQKGIERFKGLSLNQKVILSGAALLLIVAALMLILGVNRVKWAPLYTELSTEDAAAIRAKLVDMKVPYQISGDGTEILVPADKKYDVRLQLAADGLPQGVVGFESFNQSKFGETETDKKVKYQAALQGEITRTIMSLDKVQSARVNLALPERSLFEDKDTPPTASVMVKCKPGEQLTEREISGIVHLVANSVERLTPENVFVVDEHGNPLSNGVLSGTGGDTAELTVEQLKIKQSFETQKQLAIQTMLDSTLGPGHAVVRVSADLNFDKIERYQENYDPDKRVVVSEHIIEENTTSTNGTPTGIPGVGSNVPQYQTPTGTGGSETSEKSDKLRNYEGDKVQTKTVVAPGSINHMTIAVLLDKKYADQAQAIADAVASAAGAQINPVPPATVARDTVTVTPIAFSAAPTAEENAPASAGIMNYWWVGAVALVLLLAGFLLLKKRSEKEAAEAHLVDTLIEETSTLDEVMKKALSPEEKEKQRIREEIDKLIDTAPENAAQVLRTWLAEDAR